MKFGEIFNGIRGARAELNKRKAELEKFKRRREDLHRLPPPRTELADFACAWLDERAATYPRRLAGEFSFFMRHPLKLSESKDGSFRQAAHSAAGPRLPSLAFPSAAAVTVDDGAAKGVVGVVGVEMGLFYLLRDPVKKALRRAIEIEMPYATEVAPPMKERLAEIASLDKQITELEAEIKSAEDELAAALNS